MNRLVEASSSIKGDKQVTKNNLVKLADNENSH